MTRPLPPDVEQLLKDLWASIAKLERLAHGEEREEGAR
jgi:hypothetical protein